MSRLSRGDKKFEDSGLFFFFVVVEEIGRLGATGMAEGEVKLNGWMNE